ncbi:MAG: hypothetical protein ABI330_15150, partial [Caldimonas sp.]
WMFLGSDQGGETAAILFSILANAKRYQIEPFAYVRALLMYPFGRTIPPARGRAGRLAVAPHLAHPPRA